MYNSKDMMCAMCYSEDPFYCEDCDEDHNKFINSPNTIADTKKPIPKEGFVAKEADNVNHPGHYNQGSIECIEAMIQTQGIQATIDFCICNAFKYIWRYPAKNGFEDIKKAQWYINKAIELNKMKEKK